MLTVQQIIEYSRAYSPGIVERARTVQVRKMQAVEREDDDGDKYREVKAICIGDSKPRLVEFRFYGPRSRKAELWVSCPCEWFLYHCEVATKRKGSTDIIHSNGAQPRITNPRMIPSLCKHLLSALIAGAFALQPKLAKEPPKKAKIKPTQQAKPGKPNRPEKSAPTSKPTTPNKRGSGKILSSPIGKD